MPTTVVIDVPENEYWRLFMCGLWCFLPDPKAVRIKNVMAKRMDIHQ